MTRARSATLIGPFRIPTHILSHLPTYPPALTPTFLHRTTFSLTTSRLAAKLSRSISVYKLPPPDGVRAARQRSSPPGDLPDGFVVQKEYRCSAARGRRRRRPGPPTYAQRDQSHPARHWRHHRRRHLRPHRQCRRRARWSGRGDLDDPCRHRLWIRGAVLRRV